MRLLEQTFAWVPLDTLWHKPLDTVLLLHPVLDSDCHPPPSYICKLYPFVLYYFQYDPPPGLLYLSFPSSLFFHISLYYPIFGLHFLILLVSLLLCNPTSLKIVWFLVPSVFAFLSFTFSSSFSSHSVTSLPLSTCFISRRLKRYRIISKNQSHYFHHIRLKHQE